MPVLVWFLWYSDMVVNRTVGCIIPCWCSSAKSLGRNVTAQARSLCEALKLYRAVTFNTSRLSSACDLYVKYIVFVSNNGLRHTPVRLITQDYVTSSVQHRFLLLLLSLFQLPVLYFMLTHFRPYLLACTKSRMLQRQGKWVRKYTILLLKLNLCSIHRYEYTVCPFQNVTQKEERSTWNSFHGVLG